MSDDYPIPQSNALRQVDRLSLQELFSRDPEMLGESIHDVVAHMQELRERLASTETVKQVRVSKTSTPSTLPRSILPLGTAAAFGITKKKPQEPQE